MTSTTIATKQKSVEFTNVKSVVFTIIPSMASVEIKILYKLWTPRKPIPSQQMTQFSMFVKQEGKSTARFAEEYCINLI